MSFLDTLIEKDRALFVFLNGLGTESWDGFWMGITNKYTWIPLYIVLLFLLFRYFNWKKALFLLFIAALLVTFTDQFVNLIKNTIGRLRPCSDPSLQDFIRIVKKSGGYSFISGHSTNSFAVSTFMILTLRNHFKPIYLVLIWPLLFAYSRIYVGVHFPLDIITGMFVGIGIGYGFYFLSNIIGKKARIYPKFSRKGEKL